MPLNYEKKNPLGDRPWKAVSKDLKKTLIELSVEKSKSGNVYLNKNLEDQIDRLINRHLGVEIRPKKEGDNNDHPASEYSLKLMHVARLSKDSGDAMSEKIVDHVNRYESIISGLSAATEKALKSEKPASKEL